MSMKEQIEREGVENFLDQVANALDCLTADSEGQSADIARCADLVEKAGTEYGKRELQRWREAQRDRDDARHGTYRD